MLLGVSFGSYKRHCRDVLTERRGYVQMRRLGDVLLRTEKLFGVSCETCLKRPGDLLM